MAVKGLREVLANLDETHRRFIENGKRGLWKSGFLVEREANKQVPVDLGNLKASSYTKMIGPLIVQVGYTAEYALHVHEDLEANHTVGNAKFLENAEKETRSQRLDIIKKELQKS